MKTPKKLPPLTIVYGLPHSILTYVKKHFPEGTIVDMEEDKTKKDDLKYFDVDVVEGDNTFHLRFDKKGKYVHDEMEAGTHDDETSVGDNDTREPSATDELIAEF